MRKIELSTHHPTENRGIRLTINEQVDTWAIKIREAQKLQNGEGVREPILRVKDILLDLIEEVKLGIIDREVIEKVVQRQECMASLQLAMEKMK